MIVYQGYVAVKASLIGVLALFWRGVVHNRCRCCWTCRYVCMEHS